MGTLGCLLHLLYSPVLGPTGAWNKGPTAPLFVGQCLVSVLGSHDGPFFPLSMPMVLYLRNSTSKY